MDFGERMKVSQAAAARGCGACLTFAPNIDLGAVVSGRNREMLPGYTRINDALHKKQWCLSVVE